MSGQTDIPFNRVLFFCFVQNMALCRVTQPYSVCYCGGGGGAKLCQNKLLLGLKFVFLTKPTKTFSLFVKMHEDAKKKQQKKTTVMRWMDVCLFAHVRFGVGTHAAGKICDGVFSLVFPRCLKGPCFTNHFHGFISKLTLTFPNVARST